MSFSSSVVTVTRIAMSAILEILFTRFTRWTKEVSSKVHMPQTPLSINVFVGVHSPTSFEE